MGKSQPVANSFPCMFQMLFAWNLQSCFGRFNNFIKAAWITNGDF